MRRRRASDEYISVFRSAAVLVPQLGPSGTFLREREHYISIRKKFHSPATRHLRSRSVVSSPSRNDCAVFAEAPPAPACPRAAKCCAWSITSGRRPRNVCSRSLRMKRGSRREIGRTLLSISDISLACSSLKLEEEELTQRRSVEGHVHVHDGFPKSVP